MPQKFKNLKAWEEAHKLVLQVYQITADFPTDERFGLTNQIRRSAVSICANLAEGCERRTTKDYLSFIYISKASLSETQYHLLLAKDLNYLAEEKYNSLSNLADYVGAILHRLISSLEKKL